MLRDYTCHLYGVKGRYFGYEDGNRNHVSKCRFLDLSCHLCGVKGQLGRICQQKSETKIKTHSWIYLSLKKKFLNFQSTDCVGR